MRLPVKPVKFGYISKIHYFCGKYNELHLNYGDTLYYK